MAAVSMIPTLKTQKVPAMKNDTYKYIGCDLIGHLA